LKHMCMKQFLVRLCWSISRWTDHTL
jgi:hypothetical protein